MLKIHCGHWLKEKVKLRNSRIKALTIKLAFLRHSVYKNLSVVAMSHCVPLNP